MASPEELGSGWRAEDRRRWLARPRYVWYMKGGGGGKKKRGRGGEPLEETQN